MSCRSRQLSQLSTHTHVFCILIHRRARQKISSSFCAQTCPSADLLHRIRLFWHIWCVFLVHLVVRVAARTTPIHRCCPPQGSLFLHREAETSSPASKQTRIRDLLHLSSSLLFALWAPRQKELLLDKNALLPRGVGVNQELRTQKPRCIRPVPRAPPTRLRRLALRDIRTDSRQMSSGEEMDVWRGGVSLSGTVRLCVLYREIHQWRSSL